MTPTQAKNLVEYYYGDIKRSDNSTTFSHAVRVANLVVPDQNHDRFYASLLHDVLEDTDVTLSQLSNDGFSRKVMGMVIRLTRFPGDSYLDYLLNILEDKNTILIKLADMQDNLDEGAKGNMKVKYDLGQYILRQKLDEIAREKLEAFAVMTEGEI